MKRKVRFFALLGALLALFCAVSCANGDTDDGGNAGNSGNDGGSGTAGNTALCTYVQSDDESTYYIFYADKTVEYYYNGELDKARDTLKYEGDPTASGTVTLKIAATGTALLTFEVSATGSSITATGYIGDSTFGGTKYTVKTAGSGNTRQRRKWQQRRWERGRRWRR